MIAPIIVELKPQKIKLKALKSDRKYKDIKGLFEGVLIIYPKIIKDTMHFTTTITGQIIGPDKPWEIPKDKELEEL